MGAGAGDAGGVVAGDGATGGEEATGGGVVVVVAGAVEFELGEEADVERLVGNEGDGDDTAEVGVEVLASEPEVDVGIASRIGGASVDMGRAPELLLSHLFSALECTGGAAEATPRPGDGDLTAGVATLGFGDKTAVVIGSGSVGGGGGGSDRKAGGGKEPCEGDRESDEGCVMVTSAGGGCC